MSQLLKQYGPKTSAFKQYNSPFNPFNSWKVMFHKERMEGIIKWLNKESDYLPPPVYVTVDPTDVCNHGCPWCISSKIQESDNTTLKPELLRTLANFLVSSNIDRPHQADQGPYINSIVIAGGGEPLVNKGTKLFIETIAERRNKPEFFPPEYAMITNGELLTEEIGKILVETATWVGFSVDAGNEESHQKMHSPKGGKNVNHFRKVIDNIHMLCKLRAKRNTKHWVNIGYKFNIHPDSYKSIFMAAQIAKEIGCDQIQYKPTYVENAFEIMPPIIEESQELIMKAREAFEDDTFKVNGMIHKFGPTWEPNHDFGQCTMTPLGLIFSADGNMYLCCDRRGEPSLNLGPWHDGQTARPDMMRDAWGSEKHRKLIEGIKTSECPRCSFYFYNKVVQEAFVDDQMNRNFL